MKKDEYKGYNNYPPLPQLDTEFFDEQTANKYHITLGQQKATHTNTHQALLNELEDMGAKIEVEIIPNRQSRKEYCGVSIEVGLRPKSIIERTKNLQIVHLNKGDIMVKVRGESSTAVKEGLATIDAGVAKKLGIKGEARTYWCVYMPPHKDTFPKDELPRTEEQTPLTKSELKKQLIKEKEGRIKAEEEAKKLTNKLEDRGDELVRSNQKTLRKTRDEERKVERELLK